jgi:monofunctional chorismate mutase
MNNLEQARVQINDIDAKLVPLIEQRMQAVFKVAEYKKENNLPIFDEQREKIVLEKVANLVQDKQFEQAILLSFQDIMNRSKEFQKEHLGG